MKPKIDGTSFGSITIDGQHIDHDVLPLADLRPDLPPEVCDWVMRLISKEMDGRPASASQAQKEFEPVLAAIRAAANPKPAGVAVARPKAPPSPNRPKLITGPVDPLRSFAQRPHTTAHHPYNRTGGPSAMAVFLWSLVALALVAGFWLFVRERSAVGAPPPSEDPTSEIDPGPDAGGSSPAPASLTQGARRQLPTRTDGGGGQPPQRFIYENSSWKYYDKDVDYKKWFQPGFDDSAWPQGKSPLGFRDPVTTEIRGEDSKLPLRITYYFRKTIEMKNAARADALGGFVAQIQYDDGFRMYLNGKEILRADLPEGVLKPDTLALRIRQSAEEAKYVTFPLPPESLKDGTNVFAVEVHQRKLDSSDVRFSMILDFVEKKP